VVAGSLRRDGEDDSEMLAAAGTLHAAGYPIDWQRLYPAGRVASLPEYPWQRSRHWVEVEERGFSPQLPQVSTVNLAGSASPPYIPPTALPRACTGRQAPG